MQCSKCGSYQLEFTEYKETKINTYIHLFLFIILLTLNANLLISSSIFGKAIIMKISYITIIIISLISNILSFIFERGSKVRYICKDCGRTKIVKK